MTDYVARLPRKLWIGTYEVALVLVPADDKRLDPDEPDGLRAKGLSDLNENAKIYLDEGLTGMPLLEVVLHEITHVINWVYGLEEEGRPIAEENIADIHGKAWSTFLVANPRFQTWLTRTLNAIRKDQQNG